MFEVTMPTPSRLAFGPLKVNKKTQMVSFWNLKDKLMSRAPRGLQHLRD